VKRAPSDSYACGELQHGFALSTGPFSSAVAGDQQLEPYGELSFLF
jgi:hypothetical protein